MLSLAAAGTGRDVGMDWLAALPPEDDRRLFDSVTDVCGYTSTLVLIAEVFESLDRVDDSMRFALAQLADSWCNNVHIKIRSGCVLGRCHAAKGEHSLCCAAFDAALALAQVSGLA